jgi:GAF domain-containing protein
MLSHYQDKYTARAYKMGVQHVLNKSNLSSQILSHSIISAIDRKEIENEIHLRDEILKAVNNAAEIFLTEPNWNTYLNEVLASFGKATQSDRVCIYKNSNDSDGEVIALLQADWAVDYEPIDNASHRQEVLDYKQKGFQRWLQLMEDNQLICGDVDDLPPNEQPFLSKMGIKSFAYIPIFIDHTWWGFIGFDQCKQNNKWYEVEIDALRMAAKIFGAAISRRVTEDKLTYLATHDYLTDLPNRLLFEDHIKGAIARSVRSGTKFAIISIDMDKFKLVNDSFGHQVGDDVLVEVGKRLSSSIRGTDTCARIGGDEFAVLQKKFQIRVT